MSLTCPHCNQPFTLAAIPAGAGAAPSPAPAARPAADLSVCPSHGVPWTYKAAGMSKAGKPYSGFWKCDQRDGDAYCDQRPARSWKAPAIPAPPSEQPHDDLPF